MHSVFFWLVTQSFSHLSSSRLVRYWSIVTNFDIRHTTCRPTMSVFLPLPAWIDLGSILPVDQMHSPDLWFLLVIKIKIMGIFSGIFHKVALFTFRVGFWALIYLNIIVLTLSLQGFKSSLILILFQPRIMPKIPGPRHIAMQQQVGPGFFSSPPHPVILPLPQAFAGFVPLSSSGEQNSYQQSSQPQTNTVTGTHVREPPTHQGVSPPLNGSAVPFIPLQVCCLVQTTMQS